MSVSVRVPKKISVYSRKWNIVAAVIVARCNDDDGYDAAYDGHDFTNSMDDGISAVLLSVVLMRFSCY